MKKKNTLTWHWTNLGQLKQTSGSSRLSGGLMSRGLTSDAQPELRHKHLFSQRKCLSAVLLWFLFFLSFFLTVTLAVRRGCFPLLSVLINTLLSTTSTKTYMYIKKSLGWELGEMDVQLIAAGLGCHRTSTAASVASGSTPVVCGVRPSPALCYQIWFDGRWSEKQFHDSLLQL